MNKSKCNVVSFLFGRYTSEFAKLRLSARGLGLRTGYSILLYFKAASFGAQPRALRRPKFGCRRIAPRSAPCCLIRDAAHHAKPSPHTLHVARKPAPSDPFFRSCFHALPVGHSLASLLRQKAAYVCAEGPCRRARGSSSTNDDQGMMLILGYAT